MSKEANKRGLLDRLRDLLDLIDKLLNPEPPVPARIPVKNNEKRPKR